MPDQLAHYLFARRVWAALDDSLRRRIDADSPAFRAGSFGPDPLFTDPHPRRRAEGFFLHRRPGCEALDRLRFSVQVRLPLAAEYAAGFFTHYALDRLCHPELKAMHARGEANHLAVESAYDRELYLRGELDFPRRFPSDWNLCRAAVEAYHSLSVHQFRRDVKLYWAMRRMFVLRMGAPLSAIPGKINAEWDGILPYAQPSAGIRRGMEMLDTTLERGTSIAAEQLAAYFYAIDHDLPLDPWTHADFAGRFHGDV